MSFISRKKISQGILFLIVAAICITFVFSGGFSRKMSSPDAVAFVGDTPIKKRDYLNALNQRINAFTRMTGGKKLTQQQIEQFGIRRMVIGDLINNKLRVQLANELGIIPSKSELSKTIKALPYFQTNKQFDVNKYKSLLTMNKYTPTIFEDLIEEELRVQKVQTFLNQYLLSENYISDVKTFKSKKIKASAIRLHKQSLIKFVNVKKEEIETYLANKKNADKVKSLFKSKKTILDQPEKVKARHILIRSASKNEKKALKEIEKISKKINTRNFKKMANKYTQDPSGKKKGGDLGWFSRGKMVPEFDFVAFSQKPGTISDPVKTTYGYHLIYVEKKQYPIDAKLSKHENDLAKELIQKEKKEDHKQLIVKISKKLETLLKTRNNKAIKKAQKVYDFTWIKTGEINIYDGKLDSITFRNDQLKQLFSVSNSKKRFHRLDETTYLTLVYATPAKRKKSKTKPNSDIRIEQQMFFARKLQQELIKHLQENTKITTYPQYM